MGQQDSGYGAGAVLLSFFIGGIIGAGVALLTTPKTGQETRKMIRDFTKMHGIKREITSGRSRTRPLTMWTKEKNLSKEKRLFSQPRSRRTKAIYDKEGQG